MSMKKKHLCMVTLVATALIMGVLSLLKSNRIQCMGRLSKHDSLFLERVTGRKIIGDIDTTMLSPMRRDNLKRFLEKERKFVKHSIKTALDYNISEDFCIVHFFYDEDLNCDYDCPDLYVWLSDYEAKKLRKHIKNLSNGDSIFIVKSDTLHRKLHRKIKYEHLMIKSTLVGSRSGSYAGYTTILMFNTQMNNITIHNHYHSFCQHHLVPGVYENFWEECQMARETQNHGVKLIREKRR